MVLEERVYARLCDSVSVCVGGSLLSLGMQLKDFQIIIQNV